MLKELHSYITSFLTEGWRVFLDAHVNMDRLQLNMQQVPKYVKVALRLLKKVKAPNKLKKYISRILKRIKRIGNDCIKLANETHTGFSNVMNHLGEIIAVTVASKGLHESRLRETEVELNTSRLWQAELRNLHVLLKKHYESTVEDLRFAHIQYSTALALRSSKFERFVSRMVGAIVKVIDFASKIADGSFFATMGKTKGSTALNTLIRRGITPTTENGKALFMGQSFSDSIKNLISIFNDTFYSTDNQTTHGNLEEMENILYEIRTYTKLIGNSNIAKNVIKPMIDRAINVSTIAIQLVKDGFGEQVNRSEIDDVSAELNKLVQDTKKIDAAAGLISDPSSKRSNNDGSLSSDNEKMMVQITERQLREARRRSEASFAQVQKNLDEMNKLVGEIASLDLTRIDYVHLLDYMQKALRLLGTMRQTWAKLVLFFSKIASQAEITLSGVLQPFIERTGLASSNEMSIEERNIFIEILTKQSLNIHETSHSLFVMSRTYVDMSKEFLMPRLSGLSLMLAAKNDKERKMLNNQLASETIIAQKKVKALIEERKMMYSSMVETQQAKLKARLDRSGGLSVENQQSIDEASELITVQ